MSGNDFLIRFETSGIYQIAFPVRENEGSKNMEMGENKGVNQGILEIKEITKVTNAPPELSDPAMTNTLGSVLPLSMETLILKKLVDPLWA